MAHAKKGPKSAESGGSEQKFSLKKLADYLGLAPATVSLVLNGSPVADTIAAGTKAQILAAARKFNYRPNFFARCLRTQRSFTIGVLVSEVSAGYNATVLSGIEDHLLNEGYFYFVASHHFRPDLIQEYPEIFLHRAVDGLIVVSTPSFKPVPIPMVTVSCHEHIEGVRSIVVDHHHAAEVALRHLVDLGHHEIAFIKGQDFVPDTHVRWNAITEVAHRMGLPIDHRLVGQIEDNSPGSELGYKVTCKLLASGAHFTALFAFNDISALGAIRALHEFGLRIPDDVSVIGFDDIASAVFQNPPLTTVRQPLRKMGRMAAQAVLNQISRTGDDRSAAGEIVVQPELIIRGTTAPAIVHLAPQKKLVHL